MSFEGQKVGFAPLKPEKISGEYSNIALQKVDTLVPRTKFPTESGKLDRELGEKTLNFPTESGSVQIS